MVIVTGLGDILKINYEMFISLLRAHNSNIGFTEKNSQYPPVHDVYTYLGRIDVNKPCLWNN
jgi:hypothetical protein